MKDMFSPVVLGGLEIKNRFARSATDEHLADKAGHSPECAARLLVDISDGGAGLIITGHMFVSFPLGQSSVGQQGNYDDSFLPELTAMAKAGKRGGARIIAQLSHAGGKHRASERTPVSASDVEMLPEVKARALTKEEIAALARNYAEAALRCKKAGFDGVQVHCAHGYLLSQFIDPKWNVRTDSYGGSAENRARFAREIIDAVKSLCGSDYPVFVKINSDTLADNDAYLDELAETLELFRNHGVCAAELSGVDFAPKSGRLYFLERFRALSVKTALPLMLVGGVRSPQDVQTALESGACMVSMSRPFACQPDIVDRFKRGESSPCVSCNRCYQRYADEGKGCALDIG